MDPFHRYDVFPQLFHRKIVNVVPGLLQLKLKPLKIYIVTWSKIYKKYINK